MPYLMVAGGLLLLLVGGDTLVRASVSLAQRLGVSNLVIGLTVVAFGTSAPELLVSVNAVLSGAPAIAIGNVVGSNIANVLLVVAAAALIAPLYCDRAVMIREGGIMVAATLLFILVAWLDLLVFWTGLLMVLLLIGFLYASYRRAQRQADTAYDSEVAEMAGKGPSATWILALMLSGGIFGLVLGATLLVDGARVIAHYFGLSEMVIGITLVALGTSLPELATTVVAALRRHSDVAVGNVIGSNLFNILAILGITAIIAPVPVDPRILHFDVWVMLFAALVLFPAALMRRPIGRVVGMLMLLLYGAYIYAQLSGVSGLPTGQMAGWTPG